MPQSDESSSAATVTAGDAGESAVGDDATIEVQDPAATNVVGAPGGTDARADDQQPAATVDQQGQEPPSPSERGEARIDLGRVALQARVGRGVPAVLPLVIVGGPQDIVDVDNAFAELVAAPGRAWVDNAAYFRRFLGGGTMGLLAPDPQLEDVSSSGPRLVSKRCA